MNSLFLGMGSVVVLTASIIMLIIIGAGIGVGLFLCVVASALVLLGVISSSAVLGFITRKPATALRVFLLQCGILTGIPCGALLAWAGHHLVRYAEELAVQWPGSLEWQVPLLGAIGGGLGGAVLALSMDFILRRSHAWLSQRYDKMLNSAALARGTASE